MQIMHSKQKYLFVFVFGALAVSAIGLGEGAIKLTPFAPTVKKADNSNITLSCGAPVFSSATSQVYTLPNFTVNGSDEIANISIMVLTGSITATANSAFTIYSDFLASSTAAHKTQILAFSSLQTASAVSDFVRQYITFDSSANSASDVNSQDIRFSLGIGAAALESNIPSSDAISTLIDSDGNTHFYIYDAKPSGTTVSNWDKAYDYAKTLKLFGMKGYLATITSATEDAVMDALTTEGGWAGAICDTITTKDADTAAGLGQSGTTAARKVKTNWQWVCGPEAGTALFKTAGSVADGQYDGWKSTGEPNGYSLGSEWCLDLHFGGHWNDYPSSNTAGAFVEFSPYPTSTALSFDKTVPCGNWNDWSQTVAANFATYGTASRTAKNGSKTETWDTIPYLPQPDANSLNSKIGDFWTESAYTAPTSSSSGATGLIAFNERDVAIEQARSAGLVERVWPLAPGDVIAAGQPLVELLVPQWTAAQAEYLALRAGADRALVDAARERLRMLGLSAAMIDELEQSGRARQRFILYSSRGGVLESLDVRSGMAVAAGQTLARVQGIDSMWLEVAVPESRATSVQMGGDAEVQFVAYPGRSLTGRIIAVLPDLAAGSRTLRVRIELPNPDGQLRAGMSAQVRLAANTGGYALAVPTEAIIRTGKRALVIAVREDGAFSGVEVELGPEIDNRTVIVAGLAEGQSIVSSAQFLLDSEASLSGLFAPAAPATTLPESLPDEAANAMGEER
jgi:Cu(I)/Ag(I) efflux system membrane fusion protein